MKPSEYRRAPACIRTFILNSVFLFCLGAGLVQAQELKPIFNGTNLDGWIIRGGKATYTVEDGVIVGKCAVKNGGNTFLCTEKEYSDFILELEIKADNGLNSGVQIRSHCFDEPTTYDFGDRIIKIPAKRVHGYQVEVDHRPERRWSGGIYEEGRREWLNPIATNSPAGQAFKFGEWNKYRIECRGASIKTWVNGVPAADLVDAETLQGFIGLQVHSASNAEFQVRFRNIRLKDLGEHRWQMAWDCQSLDALEQQGAAVWKVQDGVLHGTHPKSEAQSGTLFSQAVLSNFSVRFKYKIVTGEFDQMFTNANAEVGKTNAGLLLLHFAERVGATNIARLQDWNTLTVSARGKRVVVNLNGHQNSDAVIETFPTASHPGLTLSGDKDADVYFKDFEILQ